MSNFNEVKVTIMAKSENEAFARSVAAAFTALYDPTLSEVADIKTAVSEAVSNAIIHGYENKEGVIHITCRVEGKIVTVTVKDDGIGIGDIEKAREPLYTTKPELERSGMGFTVMETFMDSLIVKSEENKGTEVIMTKELDKN